MRKALFLISILTIPCASTAQNKQASWQNLNAIQVGQEIQVIEMSSTKDSGTLLSVSDSAISLQTQAGERAVQRQDVRRVSIKTKARRERSTLIGLAIGTGSGVALGGAAASVCSGTLCGGHGGALIAALTGAGALLGALIGAAVSHGGWREIYGQ